MYCNSESVNKPSHPLPSHSTQFDKIWHVHYLNAYAFSSLYLKMFFLIIAGQTIKIQVYLKNSNERKKALVPTFHTLSSLLNALNSFVWTFCIVSSLAHIITGSKHAYTHHPNTHAYTLSLTMVVVQSTYLVSVLLVSILCVWYCAQYWHIEKRKIASNCQQFNNYYGNSNKHVQERITKKECMIQQ